MMEKCHDIGTIQAFLDGELSHDLAQKVSRHIALCDDCAVSLAEAEEETAVAFSALEREFDTLVPTHRLWTKINDSIVEEKNHSSVWQRFLNSVSVLISSPSMAVAAGVLLVFGVFTIVLIKQGDGTKNADLADVKKQPNQDVVLPVNSANQREVNASPSIPSFVNASNENEDKKESAAPKVYAASSRQDLRQNNVKPVAIKANYTEEIKPKIRDQRLQTETLAYLPGEESYVKTIANLSETVESQKDTVLRPSARISFERDLAVVSDAIQKMKKEVRKNPKNESAKQVLYASYQNKIDLLNSVAERNELMASLK
ncbi:MAG TPA: zf-HC2 domain-containing protein [Pyrinomonadaceae bacterium]|jgi:anti-sigma factor RsiW